MTRAEREQLRRDVDCQSRDCPCAVSRLCNLIDRYEEALQKILVPKPNKVGVSEAADMAVEFQNYARKALEEKL